MKKTINNPNVRKAVYKAFKGQCFFTGRPVSEEDMVIDHLIPKSKGGPDSFENYVLTFKDLNLGKSNKHDDKLKRMRWIVQKVYAPRARQLYAELSSSAEITVENDYNENNKIILKQFKTRIKEPQGLQKIQTKDLFWADDGKIEIFSASKSINNKNIHELLKGLETYTNVALRHGSDYCIDVWLTNELKIQLKNLWYCVNGSFFKPVKKTAFYDSRSSEKWAYVYFTKHYMNFLSWRDRINEYMEKIFEIEDAETQKKELRKFCAVFPPPERYALEMLK